MIELKDIQVTYKHGRHAHKVLLGTNLNVAEGESLAIVGPSGCGKSTLLSVIGGMLAPDSGSYRFRGEALDMGSDRRMAELRRKDIGFVFQNFCLLPQLTVLENVQLPAVVRGRLSGADTARAKDLLAQVELQALVNRKPHEISGGQAQRVAIARALMGSPSVILADEPTGNLDAEAASSVIECLLAQMRIVRSSLIVVTHSLEVARAMGRTAQMNGGNLVEQTKVQSY